MAMARAENGRAFMAYRSLTAFRAAMRPNRYGIVEERLEVIDGLDFDELFRVGAEQFRPHAMNRRVLAGL